MSPRPKKKPDFAKAIYRMLTTDDDETKKIINPEELKNLQDEFRERLYKLQGDIIRYLSKLRKRGMSVEELFQMAGELIDGAREVELMDADDSDTHLQLLTAEDIKLAIELAERSRAIDKYLEDYK